MDGQKISPLHHNNWSICWQFPKRIATKYYYQLSEKPYGSWVVWVDGEIRKIQNRDFNSLSLSHLQQIFFSSHNFVIKFSMLFCCSQTCRMMEKSWRCEDESFCSIENLIISCWGWRKSNRNRLKLLKIQVELKFLLFLPYFSSGEKKFGHENLENNFGRCKLDEIWNLWVLITGKGTNSTWIEHERLGIYRFFQFLS